MAVTKGNTRLVRAVIGRLVIGVVALMLGTVLIQSWGAQGIILEIPGSQHSQNTFLSNLLNIISQLNPWANRRPEVSSSIFDPFVWDPIERFDTSNQHYGWIGMILFVIFAAIACF
jgi:hypothetical protein